MIVNLAQNVPQVAQTFSRLTTIYMKVYSPGNLRFSGIREELTATIGLNTQDGIVQATADGWKQWFWSGDLWLICDQAGPIVIVTPTNQFYLSRGVSREIIPALPSDLSTY